MPNRETTRLNDLFAALADPTRRAVVEQLVARNTASVSELAAPHDMALPSFMQHIRVLEEAGLVTSRKQGRVRYVNLEAQPLTEAQKWLERQRKLWEGRFDRLEALVQSMDQISERNATDEQ